LPQGISISKSGLGLNMKRWRGISFMIYLIIILIFAVIYFAVPERKAFIENQVQWWSEFYKFVRSFL